MGMVVRTNTMSANAYRQLGMNNNAVSKSLEKLSSGFRINRAGDDASGLAISEKMKAQIQGLEQASANSQDGISLVQTAEGALTEVHSMLNRMVSLATKSASGTIQNQVDRDAIQTEVDALTTEITRVSQSTNFNGIQLLDGSLGTGTSGVAVSVGADAAAHTSAFSYSVSGDAGITVNFAALDSGGTKTAASWGANSTLTITLSGANGTTWSQSDIDAAIANASGAPASAANMKVTLDSNISATANTVTAAQINGATGETAIAKQATYANATNGVTVTSNKAGVNTSHVIFAAGSATNSSGTASVASGGTTTVYLDSTKAYTDSEINSILSDAGAGMSVSYDGTKTLGAGAAGAGTFGTDDVYALANGTGLASGGGLTLQVGDTNDAFNKVTVSVGDLSAKGLGISSLDVSSQTAAGNSIATIKAAINTVSTNRGALGALQNRLDYAINNLDTTAENMTSANSRIRDTDMAKEMMQYTKMNILTQAAQAMLAQANQNPQSILQLLQ